MFQSRTLGRKLFIFAAISLLTYIAATPQKAKAEDSGCVTCHLNQEMLKKTVAVQKGAKSALQSGAG